MPLQSMRRAATRTVAAITVEARAARRVTWWSKILLTKITLFIASSQKFTSADTGPETQK